MELLREPDPINGDTPTMRLFSLLELIAAKDQLVSLQGLVEETGLPKPTLHRMLQQLEGAGLLVRQADGRHYGTGHRLRRLAENLLLNATHHGARHAVLRHLVDELGESCNVTTLSGNEIVYLDRVETPEPLRFYLRPGSRVPIHCSASGKMILAQMSPSQRRKLLAHAPLKQYTNKTLTDLDALEAEFTRIRRDGFALDDEEFLPGLVCVAVLVPGRANLCVAVQAPVMRLTPDKALQTLPALQRAAEAISRVDAEGGSEPESVPS
ncbi:IclR family transcriptional regulator [Amycolatopsis roodepoortensis]|uniref:DNA-binding IclR family transcriptional regulator n=1 Tax=Amycolatopsis roodepoortensis TaxID=700274 RepID=A0ABR9L1Y8_9PSEU|nr:IclR family transcriptional regulator [Amycolatopsis roodepoortensis]MBE1574242.1 DNA-binding IclR family transcriptional regulator [Amycolatopsis roodepoortensis]